jgi:hypothetical protein
MAWQEAASETSSATESAGAPRPVSSATAAAFLSWLRPDHDRRPGLGQAAGHAQADAAVAAGDHGDPAAQVEQIRHDACLPLDDNPSKGLAIPAREGNRVRAARPATQSGAAI